MTDCTCSHPPAAHMGNMGMCKTPGCVCNLYRATHPPSAQPSRPQVQEPQAVPQASQSVLPAGLLLPDRIGPGHRDDLLVELLAQTEMMSRVPTEFVQALAEHFAKGIKDGRSADDWKELDSAMVGREKLGSLLRHAGNREWLAVAANALILWWHEQREEES